MTKRPTNAFAEQDIPQLQPDWGDMKISLQRPISSTNRYHSRVPGGTLLPVPSFSRISHSNVPEPC